jgi:hypothetical protein
MLLRFYSFSLQKKVMRDWKVYIEPREEENKNNKTRKKQSCCTNLHESFAFLGAGQSYQRVAAVVGAALRRPRNHVRTTNHVILKSPKKHKRKKKKEKEENEMS